MIERDGVTVFEGVPTMYAALLHHPDRATARPRPLRLCVSGGAALPVEVLREFEEAFGCVDPRGLRPVGDLAGRLVQPPGRRAQARLDRHPDRGRARCAWSTPTATTCRRRGRRDRDPRAQRHEGLLGPARTRPPRPSRTAGSAPATWPGVDEDGYFYIVDRKKDLIIRGGFNVYPREIEEVLYEHPAVAEAAVDRASRTTRWARRSARRSRSSPARSATPDELRDFVKERVAAYKYPRQVWLVDALPKGPTGKILRREVAPAARARARAPVSRATAPGRPRRRSPTPAAPAGPAAVRRGARGAAPVPPDSVLAPARAAPGPPAADRGPPRGGAGRRAGPDHGRRRRWRPPRGTGGSPTRPGPEPVAQPDRAGLPGRGHGGRVAAGRRGAGLAGRRAGRVHRPEPGRTRPRRATTR